MNLLITNIQQLVTVESGGARFKRGSDMNNLGIIENAAVLILDGKIARIGFADQLAQEAPDGIDVLDANGKIALPGFVDAHTHACFVGARDFEFALRCSGASYAEIAHEGGGILRTVGAVRASSRKELRKATERHLDSMLKHGTTTVEIKTGYGLDMDSEVMMLNAIDDIGKDHYLDVVSTFLPAHAVPPEFSNDRKAYIRLVIDKMIPYAGKRKLAAFCDVFCEKGFFSVEESHEILTAAQANGMKPKIHADELSDSGGAELAASLGAISADHLEHISEKGIDALRSSDTVAVLLPGVSFSLNHGYAPARKLIDAGIPVAISSDFNPGSCMSFSMPMMMTIACTQMHMTPEEAITASTINGAAAIGMSEKVGSIEVGKQGDILILDVPHYRFVPYFFGVNHVWRVVKNGTILEF